MRNAFFVEAVSMDASLMRLSMPSTILRGRRRCLANAVLDGLSKMKAMVRTKYGKDKIRIMITWHH
jgi:hypothetical protein